MKRKTAIVVIWLALALIAAIIVTGFGSISSDQPSPDAQRVRMYSVFATYLILLFAVRTLLKTNQAQRSPTGWSRGIKVMIGSIALSGAVFLCVVVLSVVIGGSDAVESVIPKILVALPAIAVVAAPFVMKRLT